MIDFVLRNILPYVVVGIIAGLWIAVRDRRKAVDRLWDAIGETWSEGDYPNKKIARCGCRERIEGWISLRNDDAPGRVIDRAIARSVKRMTKEKR